MLREAQLISQIRTIGTALGIDPERRSVTLYNCAVEFLTEPALVSLSRDLRDEATRQARESVRRIAEASSVGLDDLARRKFGQHFDSLGLGALRQLEGYLLARRARTQAARGAVANAPVPLAPDTAEYHVDEARRLRNEAFELTRRAGLHEMTAARILADEIAGRTEEVPSENG
jgi:hypothetical protein